MIVYFDDENYCDSIEKEQLVSVCVGLLHVLAV